MNYMQEKEYCDYIVYVDESGHAASEPDPQFPCFVLAFCIFKKDYYLRKLVPSLQQLKFDFWGHDMIIMHEREIRKSLNNFSILQSKTIREDFHHQLTHLMQAADFEVIYYYGEKNDKTAKEDLYHIATQHCLEQLYIRLQELKQGSKQIHVIFEARGKKEDKKLELEFRRICSGGEHNQHRKIYNFTPIIADKKCNSAGLQFADLVARPLALNRLRPTQTNRAYDIIKSKHLSSQSIQSEMDLAPKKQ